MKTIRTSVFETNSSSMHAIVIPRGNVFNKEPVNVCMDGGMTFSDRKLVERKLPDEKASYCFLIIMKYWSDKLACGRWSSQKKDYLNLTAKQVKRNNEIVAAYRKFIAYMKKSFKKHWNINLTIKNTKIESKKNGAYIGSKNCASNGCYGHATFQSIIMRHMLATIDKVTQPGADLSVLSVDDSCDSYLDFCELASFILDTNAVVIQNTDECDDKDKKKMLRMIVSYVGKNHGKCFVDWPLGG